MGAMAFKLQPAAKDYLWGGSSLKTKYGKQIYVDPLAETWECSTHPDGPSVVAGGVYAGRTLTEVLARHPEFLGTRALALTVGKPELPIIVKLIDAAKDLSVQVHPDDEYARKVENSLGKTEMWYVLQVAEGARLVYSFNRDVTVEEVRAAVEDGSMEQLLNYVPVEQGDFFYVEAGTVRAICAGALLVEVLENSNITYRLYDYDRMGKDGKKRELHVEKALQVADHSRSQFSREIERKAVQEDGYTTELLKSCKHFTVSCVRVDSVAPVRPDESSFHTLLCIEGEGILNCGEDQLPFSKGDTIFIPAGSDWAEVLGKVEYLDICC